MRLEPAFIDAWTPRVLALLRIATAFMFVQHATAKLIHFPHVPMFDTVRLASLLGAAGVIELVGGFLVFIGLYTRLAAFILSGEMAVAYFMAHAPRGAPLSPLLNGGEPAALYAFIYLLLAVAGAGSWSLDALRLAPREFSARP